VKTLRGIARQAAHFEAFQDVQGDEGGESLAVRRDLPDVEPAIVCADRLYPGAGVAREILFRQQPSRPGGKGGDACREFASIERLRAGLGDQPQAPRHVRALPDLAHFRRPAGRREYRSPLAELVAAQPALQLRHSLAPFVLGNRRDGMAVVGVIDGGCEEGGEGMAAETPVQVAPSRRRTGDGDAQPAAVGDFTAAALSQEIRRHPERRTAGAVQTVQFLSIPHQGEGVSAHAAGGGFDDREGRRCRDRRVDGVSPVLEDGQTRLRRQGLARRDHPSAGIDRPPCAAVRDGRVGDMEGIFFHNSAF